MKSFTVYLTFFTGSVTTAALVVSAPVPAVVGTQKMRGSRFGMGSMTLK